MKTRIDLFAREALLFVLALAAGLFTAHHYGAFADRHTPVQPIVFTWHDAIVLVIVFVAISLLFARFRGIARISFRLFFVLILYSGAQIVAATVLPFPWDALCALAVLLVFWLWPTIASHNIAVIAGVAGISALLGLSLTPNTALVILVFLSLYDIIAVYRTKHMIRLARNMIASGAVFGFLIPLRWDGFLALRRFARAGKEFMILGSGDIGLPILFAASLVTTSLVSALIVAGFSVVGLFGTHLLFINQGERRPMAALPPITTAAIIGYLVSFLVT